MKVFIFFFLGSLLSLPLNAKVTVQGHRGARALRPENTLAALKYALKEGVDILEFDLAVTKDHQLILSHDPKVNSIICFDPKGKIKPETPFYKLTLKEAKTLDCGSRKNPRFPTQKPVPGEQIPTLAEVFEWANTVKNQKLIFNIETKIFPYYSDITASPEVFSKLLVSMIEKYGLTNRVIIQSFDYRTLKVVKKLNPKIQIAQLTYEGLFDFLSIAKSIGAEWISPNFRWVTYNMTQHLHKNNVKISTWTLNKPEEWEYALKAGVDSIITDDPRALIKYLKKKNLR